jgi:hypothetical protein
VTVERTSAVNDVNEPATVEDAPATQTHEQWATVRAQIIAVAGTGLILVVFVVIFSALTGSL